MTWKEWAHAPTSHPAVSVVTVVRNDLAGIEITGKSLEAQTRRDFEWIVVDGDSSESEVPDVDDLVGCSESGSFLCEPDGGIYDAMNKGAQKASGDFVWFLNAGDVIPGEAVMGRLIDAIATLPADTVLIGATARYRYGNGVALERSARGRRAAWHGLPSQHQATLFRRAYCDALGWYGLDYRCCGDYELVARVLREGAGYRPLDMVIADFRVGDYSFSNPRLLLGDAWRIQRDILGLPLPLRLISLTRRAAAWCGHMAVLRVSNA